MATLGTPPSPAGIRRLLPSDAPAYRALMLEGYAQAPHAFTTALAEREGLPLAWWAQRLSDAPAALECVVGTFAGAALLGAAGLRFEQRTRTRHKATLFGMYVRPGARGQGAGRALVQQVLALARQVPGTLLVQLSVSADNAAAVALYRGCGFEAFGTEPLAVQYADRFVAKTHMWCPLAAPPPSVPDP
jgi:ribosomal protein S18 acetylase RimI-like enzyme